MASTSSEALASGLLDCCLEGRPWDSGALRALIDADPGALFGVVIEGLGDRFEPALCELAARLLAEAIEYTVPGVRAADLLAHHARARYPRRVTGEPEKVFVLSRVTLGADVAVSSVMLDAARKRFPRACLIFAGPRKNWELFSGAAVEHLEIPYNRRGGLVERLRSWELLRQALDVPGSIVVDPDSRLTQLGLLPVCPEDRYYFFESRAYGGDSDRSLAMLARQWAAEVFGIEDAKAFLAPVAAPVAVRSRLACVSFGVGGNAAKRVPDPFEGEVLRALVEAGFSILVDKGGDAEEAARVDRAVEQLGANAKPSVQTWQGAFAPFAASIAKAALYVGYDSSGQHVAAACGVPLVTVFAGEPSSRFFARWSPSGPGPIEIVRASGQSTEEVLAAVGAAVGRLSPSRVPPSGPVSAP